MVFEKAESEKSQDFDDGRICSVYTVSQQRNSTRDITVPFEDKHESPMPVVYVDDGCHLREP